MSQVTDAHPNGLDISDIQPEPVNFDDDVQPSMPPIRSSSPSTSYGSLSPVDSPSSPPPLNTNGPWKVIAFVNSKSGARLGDTIKKQLSEQIGEECVFDLMECKGPQKGLEAFSHVQNLRVVVCGGDGSVLWVLSEIEKLPPSRRPQIAVLPLGTGNDCARVLKWGGGYSKNRLFSLIHSVHISTPQHWDKWHVSVQPLQFNPSASPSPISASQAAVSSSVGEPKVHNMMNYFSVGFDACSTFNFHNFRNAHQIICSSTVVNKFLYGYYGVKTLLEKIPLHELIELEVDGHTVPFKSNIRSIIVVNIPSYAAGTPLWHTNGKKKNWQTQKIDDGLIEIVGLRGPLHFGFVRVSMAKAKRLAQGRQIKITWKKNVPLFAQIDGEPYVQDPCSLTVSLDQPIDMLTNVNHTQLCCACVACGASAVPSSQGN